MDRIIIEDIFEVAELMHDNATKKKDIMFVGLYEDAIKIIKDLLSFDDINIARIDIEPEELDAYDKEYYVNICGDMELWCIKAYYDRDQTYWYDETDILFIADDCNSKILDNIDYDKAFEVGYEEECDGDCEHCVNGENSHEVVTRVATDGDGNLRGFEKSWETKEDGMTYHSTYSFYSSDQEMLKNMLENFKIKY